LDQPEKPPQGHEEEEVDPPRLALLLLVLFPFLLMIVLGLLFGWIGN
jgi:hypothetical protein